MVKDFIKRLKKKYIENQVDNTEIPKFSDSEIVNKNFKFSGNVQGVGFRFQFMLLAQELELVGWVKNLSDGRVEAEVQGPREKIEFLIDDMKNKQRIRIDNIEEKEQSINNRLEEFKVVY
ncbi:MAG: acylphosphatase [Miniphocaeibacter sp.]|uniref:acylphosphatase n=1 Tax=Miniphocaeibacter sp. TaxID=3100973 RepID=UPI00180028A7|nr:acylphosphatase [Gallicola sp.]